MSARSTVLVVEDDPDLLRFAQVTLRLGGYRPVGAIDGEAGLRAARKGRPDVVVLDLRLPGLDGWQVLEALRALPGLAEVPVLMLTASADLTARERALAAGVVAYLVKPVSADGFLAAVETALASRRAEPPG